MQDVICIAVYFFESYLIIKFTFIIVYYFLKFTFSLQKDFHSQLVDN